MSINPRLTGPGVPGGGHAFPPPAPHRNTATTSTARPRRAPYHQSQPIGIPWQSLTPPFTFDLPQVVHKFPEAFILWSATTSSRLRHAFVKDPVFGENAVQHWPLSAISVLSGNGSAERPYHVVCPAYKVTLHQYNKSDAFVFPEPSWDCAEAPGASSWKRRQTVVPGPNLFRSVMFQGKPNECLSWSTTAQNFIEGQRGVTPSEVTAGHRTPFVFSSLSTGETGGILRRTMTRFGENYLSGLASTLSMHLFDDPRDHPPEGTSSVWWDLIYLPPVAPGKPPPCHITLEFSLARRAQVKAHLEALRAARTREPQRVQRSMGKLDPIARPRGRGVVVRKRAF
ncbi:hypothetical protein JCM6882_007405 [Rhodosporidiobolus microsporus]